MLTVRLRQAIEEFNRRTGKQMTYEKLAEVTGLSKATLESIGSRTGYNTTLQTIDLICEALDCRVEDLVVPSAAHSDDAETGK